MVIVTVALDVITLLGIWSSTIEAKLSPLVNPNTLQVSICSEALIGQFCQL